MNITGRTRKGDRKRKRGSDEAGGGTDRQMSLYSVSERDDKTLDRDMVRITLKAALYLLQVTYMMRVTRKRNFGHMRAMWLTTRLRIRAV